MKVTVDTAVPTADGLTLGLVLRYSEAGPIRFARAHFDWDQLDTRALLLVGHYADQAVRRQETNVEEDEPLPGLAD